MDALSGEGRRSSVCDVNQAMFALADEHVDCFESVLGGTLALQLWPIR
jgi:hypothetical protein